MNALNVSDAAMCIRDEGLVEAIERDAEVEMMHPRREVVPPLEMPRRPSSTARGMNDKRVETYLDLINVDPLVLLLHLFIGDLHRIHSGHLPSEDSSSNLINVES